MKKDEDKKVTLDGLRVIIPEKETPSTLFRPAISTIYPKTREEEIEFSRDHLKLIEEYKSRFGSEETDLGKIITNVASLFGYKPLEE